MNTPVRVLLGLVPTDEQAIEQLLYGGEQLLVTGAGANASELLTLAHARGAEVALVSPDLPGLDAGSVARLRANGVHTIGLALDESAASALASLDVDAIARPPLSVQQLLEEARNTGTPPPGAVGPRLEGEPSAGRANVLAVVGGKGAPGASELALSFAALATRHGRVLLAECDGDDGALAVRADADPQQGSLLGLARALQRGDAELEQLFPRWLAGGERGWPQLLLGAPDPQRTLDEIVAPGGVPALVGFLADRFELVVCDVGHRLARAGEPDPAVRLHRDLLVAADAVLLVLGARPDQLHDGFRQLGLLLDELAIPQERLRVVVNGQPAAAAPGSADAVAAITHALEERELTVDAWLPWDARALRASLRLGLPLALARPRGRYAKAVRRLLDAIVASTAEQADESESEETVNIPAAAEAVAEVALPWR